MDAALSEFHAGNATRFLQARGLRMDDLVAAARRQYDDAVHVLLTSSAVHGIANAASDIDLICLRRDESSDTAMATQVHLESAHIEVMAFSESLLEKTVSVLRRASGGALADRVRAYAGLRAPATIPAKYLERICTGVDEQGRTPGLAFHAVLCETWAAVGLDHALQAVQCCALALRAGEPRAAAGYSANALLHLMNALLADAGWPLMNKKWTLKRWQMSRALFGGELLASLRQRVDAAWCATLESFSNALDPSVAREVTALVDAAGSALLHGRPVVAASPEHGVGAEAAFLPGASFLVSRESARATLLPESALSYPAGAPLAALFDLEPAHAAAWLALVRAGVVNLSIA
jgi:hypothetical protein